MGIILNTYSTNHQIPQLVVALADILKKALDYINDKTGGYIEETTYSELKEWFVDDFVLGMKSYKLGYSKPPTICDFVHFITDWPTNEISLSITVNFIKWYQQSLKTNLPFLIYHPKTHHYDNLVSSLK
jgi:hypothetical protein